MSNVLFTNDGEYPKTVGEVYDIETLNVSDAM